MNVQVSTQRRLRYRHRGGVLFGTLEDTLARRGASAEPPASVPA